MIDNAHIAKPFVKWVGGKGQLLLQMEERLPQELYGEEFTYIEPFVGGGAMLFFMLQKFPNIKRAVINDINSNLTCAYATIKNDAAHLVKQLKHLEKQYNALLNELQRKEFYLEMRRCFNNEVLTDVEKTSLLLFLNRTCFNGLYRENSKGEFNVPFGRYANPKICNEELIYADSELLNKHDVQIMNGDFKQTITAIDSYKLNFFYFDPPYRPLSATSSFNSYVKETFNDDNQMDLAHFCRNIATYDNVFWMLSNSDCSSKNPSDVFFENLYKGFSIQRVTASRMVNASANKRGKLTELLICNYENIAKTQITRTHLKIAL